MATRTRRSWKPDPRGYYSRRVGWHRSGTGKLTQPKFILGTDRQQAEVRERKLRELWEQFEADKEESRPLWPDDLLIVAKRVAKGLNEVPVPRGPKERQVTYADRLRRMQAKYPVISFVPDDRRAYEVGLAALESFEEIPVSDDLAGVVESLKNVDVNKATAWQESHAAMQAAGIKQLPDVDVMSLPIKGTNEASSDRQAPRFEPVVRKNRDEGGRTSTPPSATLHQAIRSYQKYVCREFHRPELCQISSWGRTQVRQLDTLMKHHADALLTSVDRPAVNELVGYWRRRPCKTGTDTPMTSKSCGNYLSALLRFLKWLDGASNFDWVKPTALSDLDTRVRRLASDHAGRSLEQVKTFSLDELRLLIRYGQPTDRLLVLLALNCGFGNAEIASLLTGEVHLFKAHTPWEQEQIAYETTDRDSFIKRVRRKSGVYGEHLLFSMTVQGVQWAVEQRKKWPDADEAGSRLLLNENGKPLDNPTRTGNANQSLANRFDRLIARIRDDDNDIRKLSFGKLRKTASQLIKIHSDGETMGIFDCHGQPVKSDSLTDVYSNRLFGRVFEAIRSVENYLAPVFREAERDPFAPQSQAYTKRSTVDRIVELHEAGVFPGQIAAAVGLTGEAVSRHIRRHLQTSQS